jgi:hypothetical protein
VLAGGVVDSTCTCTRSPPATADPEHALLCTPRHRHTQPARHCDGTKVDPYRYALSEAAAAPPAPVGSPEPITAPSTLPTAADVDVAIDTALPESAPSPGTAALAVAAAALVQDAPATPSALQPPAPTGSDAAAVAQPAQTDDQPERSGAGPAAGSRHDETEPAPEPAAPPPMATLPDLPPHARWLLGFMPHTRTPRD